MRTLESKDFWLTKNKNKVRALSLIELRIIMKSLYMAVTIN